MRCAVRNNRHGVTREVGMRWLKPIPLQEDAVKSFIARYRSKITGTLSGFDRIIFRGALPSLSRAEALEAWLNWKGVRFKDYSNFVQAQSARLKEHAQTMAQKAGRPYEHLRSPKIRKDQQARAIAQRDDIQDGLICVFGCVEPCMSYAVRKNPQTNHLFLKRQPRQCLFLYFYFLDREFGFMHVRLQTWFPFDLQVYVNGREWLARKMDQENLSYRRLENCFEWLSNPTRAQELADAMIAHSWPGVLNHFAKRVNPLAKDLLRGLSYYWTARQVEYATDVMFESAQALATVYPEMTSHAIRTFRSENILRFLGFRRPGHFKGDAQSTLKRRTEGVCLRHTISENSIKMYDKFGIVLRVETTINNPRRFTVYRRTRRRGRTCMAWIAMRRGVVDMRRRAELSRAANARYLEALAGLPDARPAREVLDPVLQPQVDGKKRFRPLRPVSASEARLFASLQRGEFLLNGFRNRDLRTHLYARSSSDAAEERRRATQVTRLLRLLQAHGLIHKLYATTRYLTTLKGRAVMATALAIRNADSQQLLRTG